MKMYSHLVAAVVCWMPVMFGKILTYERESVKSTSDRELTFVMKREWRLGENDDDDDDDDDDGIDDDDDDDGMTHNAR